MSIINIITIIVSAALMAAFLELLKFLFSRASSFWKDKKDKVEEKKPLKKKSSPFFDVADFTSKKKNPYEEK